jgi:uncharacterized membrane protein YfcA
MNWQDLINGAFEAAGCFFILLHILRLLKDKKVRGISVVAFTYFTLWGFWNIYYYPHLDQWISFAGGTAIAIVNGVYVLLILYYIRKEKHESIP